MGRHRGHSDEKTSGPHSSHARGNEAQFHELKIFTALSPMLRLSYVASPMSQRTDYLVFMDNSWCYAKCSKVVEGECNPILLSSNEIIAEVFFHYPRDLIVRNITTLMAVFTAQY